MANAEAALIALRRDSPSATVLADDEWSAENVTGEWSPRTAAKNDPSVPQNIHLLSIRGQYESRRPPRPAPRREVDTAGFKCRQHCACARVPADAAFDSGTVWSRDILLSRRVWNCDSSRRMCTAFPACFLFIYFLPFFFFLMFGCWTLQ
ncbi:exo-alpha-sialidase [Trypanosoma cruzi]|nr:exo-alpha-sialidase [Trypanosoma cruzi]